jgi:hypothetical protein
VIRAVLTSDGSHLIFGPYCRLAPGDYRVVFVLDLELERKNRTGELRFDVLADVAEKLSEHVSKPVSSASGLEVPLYFSVKSNTQRLEFRISARRFNGGALIFRGVHLSPFGSEIDQLSDHALTTSLGRFSPVKWPRSYEIGPLSISLGKGGVVLQHDRRRRAAKAFAAGNAARDAADWNTAATAYQEGLLHQPSNAAIWVQLGHALKESGRHLSAEQAYRTALALKPEEDTYLQLGHVLRLMGRSQEAAASYQAARSLNPDTIGQSASTETTSLGSIFGRANRS